MAIANFQHREAARPRSADGEGGPAMMSKVSFRNFKSLRDVEVDLERITVFVGPNASGKSSILQGLNLLCGSFQAKAGNVEDKLVSAMSRGSEGPVELTSEVDGHSYRYRTQTPNSTKNPPPGQSKWTGDGRGESANPRIDEWSEWKAASSSKVPLPLSILLNLEASKLVQPNPTSDPTTMSPDGSGLHSALASMALNDPDTWQQLQDDLRRIIPTIRRLRHTKTTPNQPISLLFDTVGADSLPATQVSEGTLLVLGLLAALHAPDRPSLVLLDDLDRGLHPKAQKELISLLRGLLDTNPDLQVVATTHSPYMLDCMETDEVRMTFLNEDGATVCAALTSHPKYPKWKDEMTPGEMWSLFGEKWLVEDVNA
jgi:predicted ATPase